MAKSPDKQSKPTDKKAEELRDKVLERMLETPPTPHKASEKGKPDGTPKKE